ncbi:hypothetical protein [Thermococcus sp.]
MREGLKPMKRQFIHLSTSSLETARERCHSVDYRCVLPEEKGTESL